MITIDDIYNKAVEIAQANPDFNYVEWAAKQPDLAPAVDCAYFLKNNTPACLFGHVFNAFDIDPDNLNSRDINESGIDHVIECLISDGIVDDQDTDGSLDKIITMQDKQDQGIKWGQVVREVTR